MAASAACECGAEDQTVDHIVFQCPIHLSPWIARLDLDDKTIDWLLNTWPEI